MEVESHLDTLGFLAGAERNRIVAQRLHSSGICVTGLVIFIPRVVTQLSNPVVEAGVRRALRHFPNEFTT